MKSRHMLLLLAITVFLPLKSASAFDFISQNIYGSFLEYDAYFSDGYGNFAGIRMPDGSSTPSLTLNFIVPSIIYQVSEFELVWHGIRMPQPHVMQR